jgi:hypothetical protein
MNNLEHWDTIMVLSHFASGYVNGDMSGYEEEDIAHVDSLATEYPFDEYVLDWKFDEGTEFALCDISNVRGDCVAVEVYRFKD